jgi:hypothetical protein
MTDATELDEAAARARCDAATEGPWRTRTTTDGVTWVGFDGEVGGGKVALFRLFQMMNWAVEADAEFIAHARTDLPAALDENARLRSALDEARAEVERRERHDPLWADAFAKIEARAEAAESALAAVRALVDEWGAATCISDGAPCSFHRHADGYRSDVLAVLPAPTSPERSEP